MLLLPDLREKPVALIEDKGAFDRAYFVPRFPAGLEMKIFQGTREECLAFMGMFRCETVYEYAAPVEYSSDLGPVHK